MIFNVFETKLGVFSPEFVPGKQLKIAKFFKKGKNLAALLFWIERFSNMTIKFETIFLD